MNEGLNGRRYIIFSLLAVACLQLMPLPSFLMPWRPMLPVLAVVYWAYIVPTHFGAILAFFYGLTVEAALGMPTLQLALPCAIMALVVQTVVMKLRSYSVFQQSLYIASLMLIVGLLAYPLSQASLSFDVIKPLGRNFISTVIIWCILAAWLEPLSSRYVSIRER